MWRTLSDAKDSRPQSPSEGLASRQREADGLAFLEELKQLIASIEPVNTSDCSYRDTLKKLYESFSQSITGITGSFPSGSTSRPCRRV